MKTFVLTMMLILLMCVGSVFASSPPWIGDGPFTFSDTDPYFTEASIGGSSPHATLNIIGGSFGALHCHDYSTVNMSNGVGASIGMDDYSILNLTGGQIETLVATNALFFPNYSQMHIFVQDYIFNPNSYINYDGKLTGHWDTGQEFSILIYGGTWSHVDMHIIPEPATISLLTIGILFLKRRSI
jgi:hypothetical protein